MEICGIGLWVLVQQNGWGNIDKDKRNISVPIPHNNLLVSAHNKIHVMPECKPDGGQTAPAVVHNVQHSVDSDVDNPSAPKREPNPQPHNFTTCICGGNFNSVLDESDEELVVF